MENFEDGRTYFNVSFSGLEWPEADYSDIEFEECLFSDCDFSGTTFKDCRLTNCEFRNCNLSLTELTQSRLFGITFQDSKLVGVDWTRADWPSFHVDFELQFIRCLLNDSSFFGLTLNELILQECKLHDVDFREGNFKKSVMCGSDFTRSLFMRSDLQGADFSDATDYMIDVLENQIKGAKFSRYEALNLLGTLGIELVD
ncbi:Pentapeptide repeats (8 copies) [Vibrio aerogenes CECT 7868]|uniref:Pentapeptide repeats (8 copies) n=1 Tax=Vibrio aerogenes CECT 7868 TaxID=1216006 RepID=A0A1M5XAV5_9VIBR|nr:pentapeptide repeat-containing protein [Vibrio aerogenes]SHH96941.1 Pentapeptide repeats (8 copies) [Vibrio aerogenes CECT 7868]